MPKIFLPIKAKPIRWFLLISGVLEPGPPYKVGTELEFEGCLIKTEQDGERLVLSVRPQNKDEIYMLWMDAKTKLRGAKYSDINKGYILEITEKKQKDQTWRAEKIKLTKKTCG